MRSPVHRAVRAAASKQHAPGGLFVAASPSDSAGACEQEPRLLKEVLSILRSDTQERETLIEGAEKDTNMII